MNPWADFDKAVDVCQNIILLDATHIAEFLLGKVYYYMGALEKSGEIFLHFQDSQELEFRAGANAFLGMIAAQREDSQEAERLAERIKKFTAGPYVNSLKLASIYFGIGNIELGQMYIDNFFENLSPKKMKHVQKRYIELDKNFTGVLEEARILF